MNRGFVHTCATEKHDVAAPIVAGAAPMFCMCSGSDDIAMPSPSIWTNTPSCDEGGRGCSWVTIHLMELMA